MAKEKTIFVCSSCGGEHLAWQGKCQFCQEWNTLKEMKISLRNQKSNLKNQKYNSEVIDLSKIETKDFGRITTGIGEFDRVLGGGIVPGSVILLGGDPGIGKSTLLLQVASNLSLVTSDKVTSNKENPKQINLTHPLPLTTYPPNSVLYVSGEESAGQVKIRLDRLVNKTSNMQFLAETDVDAILAQISNFQFPTSNKIPNSKFKIPNFAIIDSIQTMYDSNFPSTPGSIVQVRECALRLQQFAKQTGTTVILVGHVTKDGNVAGPRTLEHLVDVVLYLEGERLQNQRILRGVKNRFGATDEIGIFTMSQEGLKEVIDPSKSLINNRIINQPGSVLTIATEGTRPIILEVQALTSKTIFGYPKRACSGFDLNRLNLLIAVLGKKLKLALDNQDIYINIVGGIRLKDPACDLAICLAIISAYREKSIDPKLVFVGEVGLLGEIKPVVFHEKRLNEAKRLGFNSLKGIFNLEQIYRELFK